MAEWLFEQVTGALTLVTFVALVLGYMYFRDWREGRVAERIAARQEKYDQQAAEKAQTERAAWR
jgi:Tfp pilus assembly protein PilN